MPSEAPGRNPTGADMPPDSIPTRWRCRARRRRRRSDRRTAVQDAVDLLVDAGPSISRRPPSLSAAAGHRVRHRAGRPARQTCQGVAAALEKVSIRHSRRDFLMDATRVGKRKDAPGERRRGAGAGGGTPHHHHATTTTATYFAPRRRRGRGHRAHSARIATMPAPAILGWRRGPH